MSSYTKNELIQDLKRGPVNIRFRKVDGSVRIMVATLNEDVVPSVHVPGATTKKPNPDVLAVWDVENGGWRSFRWDSLLCWGEDREFVEAEAAFLVDYPDNTGVRS